MQITGSSTQLGFSGFEQLPLAIFVRGIPGGTLEQLIFRLNILHAAYQMDIVVYNTPRGIEKTVDKAMTSFLLKQAGLPTPDTWVCESKEQAKFVYQQACKENEKLVMKPLFGSQGIGVHLLDDDTGLIEDDNFAGIYYLQSFVDCGNEEVFDIRILVIGGKAVAAMTRHGKLWITNRAQGASCKPLQLSRELCQLSECACRAVGIDYGGVDIICDSNQQLQIIEVNSIPAWQGLQRVTDFNIASALVNNMLSKIRHFHPDVIKAIQ